LGHNVTTLAPLAQDQQEMFVDGVRYVNVQLRVGEMVQQEWDVVVVSRWYDLLQQPWRGIGGGYPVILFWTHDVSPGATPPLKAHKVVCLSEFHAGTWHFPPGSYEIIGDGVDLSLFRGTELTRNENILVWTSNPDRGAALAAKIFVEEILPRWPDLQMHFFGRAAVYGWPPEMEGPYLPREEHLVEGHVFVHDPLTKAGLAKMLREAWAWFYPTYWPETYCIAALEAQAAGTPVVCSRYGALMETVKGGIVTYDFVNAISQLRNKSRWKKLSELGKETAQGKDWDDRAKEWVTLIEKVRNEQDSKST
jgi:glycosyltransferase involved in cell wall biosynthesis